MYDIIEDSFPSYKKAITKYKIINRGNKQLETKYKDVIEALNINPRSNKFKPHKLKGKMEGFWSMDTGINSNSDRLIFLIDDDTKTIHLYDIGNHSIYEALSFKELFELNHM